MAGILSVKDSNGNWIDIPAIVGAAGKDGKSAYKYAQEGGYTGTEEEFSEQLANGFAPSDAPVTSVNGKTGDVKVTYLAYGDSSGATESRAEIALATGRTPYFRIIGGNGGEYEGQEFSMYYQTTDEALYGRYKRADGKIFFDKVYTDRNPPPTTSVDIPASDFGIPVLVLEGDISGMNKDNAVTLTYYYGDRTGTLTCKWQGSSSLYFPKKNYTIKFDNAFEAKAGWGAQKKYCLKANWVDASNIRNLLGAKIWGNMVKIRDSADARLKALPNGGAVDGFPVWVKINGEDVGLYTWNIPKDAWMMGMTGANAGEAILCGDGCDLTRPLSLDGELLKYDDGNPDNYQQIKIEYTASEDKSALVSSINNLISVVNNVQSADDLAALEAVLDIDSVIDYMILSGLMAHYDGTLKNWILATYDGVKWFMSAYDMDATFGNTWDGNGIRWANEYPFVSDITSLSLFPTVRTWYRDAIKTRWDDPSGWDDLSGWTMSETELDGQVYNLAKDFPAELVSRDNRLWPTRPGTMTNNHEQIINWIRRRIVDLSWNIKDVL